MPRTVHKSIGRGAGAPQRLRRGALALLAGLAAACAAVAPEEASSAREDPRLAMLPPGIERAWLPFTLPRVKVGDLAPDFELSDARGTGTQRLSELRGRPVLLVFGSYT